MDTVNNVVNRFREARLKITPQRLAIFELLEGNRSHPSVEDIYREVLKTHPSISFTTVYKTLQTLRDMGEITEIAVNPERVHYDPEVRHHVHVFCTSCRNLEDLSVVSPTSDADDLVPGIPAGVSGFEVTQVQVHLLGTCQDCQG